jgi:hypothetical protein
LTNPAQVAEPERNFTLTPTAIAAINPNTKTAPVFRARADAELAAKIYDRVPVLIDEAKGAAGNPWGVEFRQGLFNMTSDSGLFRTAAQLTEAGYARDGTDWVTSAARSRQASRYVPLYEAKMIHQFDHRWASYDGEDSRGVSEAEKRDPAFEPIPRYWVPESEVVDRLAVKNWRRGWLMGWRDICRATDERTVIASAFPRVGSGDTLLVKMPSVGDPRLFACNLANLCSLTLDYCARQKIAGTHLKYNIFKQLPVLPPAAYFDEIRGFIVSRVLELTYTSHAMATFARDLGYDGPPFVWDADRRPQLRAELDAFYARAYDLNRDELRYILDPTEMKGADYPSETFRVLRDNEKKKYGEYRTARLVMQAFDELTAKERAA